MKQSASKVIIFFAFFSLYSTAIVAQEDAASLKDIKKIIFNVSWSGNVSPLHIGVNTDSLFTNMIFDMTEGTLLQEVIDGRGIQANTQSIPQLLADVQIRTFLEDYIFYFISVALMENVKSERLAEKSFRSIIWLNQDYSVSEKVNAAEDLKTLLGRLQWRFIDAYNKDNWN